MRKTKLYVIRRQGELYTRFSLSTHRDTVTGDLSVSFTLPGKSWTFCFEKTIPELSLLMLGETERI